MLGGSGNLWIRDKLPDLRWPAWRWARLILGSPDASLLMNTVMHSRSRSSVRRRDLIRLKRRPSSSALSLNASRSIRKIPTARRRDEAGQAAPALDKPCIPRVAKTLSLRRDKCPRPRRPTALKSRPGLNASVWPAHIWRCLAEQEHGDRRGTAENRGQDCRQSAPTASKSINHSTRSGCSDSWARINHSVGLLKARMDTH